MTDTDIFTFALNLEYLEAEFFTWATTARLRLPMLQCMVSHCRALADLL